ncbi:MAG: restriction endonuclease subunit S [Acidimicrobiales bacterium]
MPEFIAMAVNVGAGRQQIERRLKTTAGQVGIAGSQLKTVEIPIPPVEEQWRLVRGAEHQRSILEELMRMIDHTRIRSDHLRRSILERAFSGQLVRQDLSDEPASEMLIRISAGAMSTVLGPERRPV